jgi:hypothetical protein
MCLRNINSQNIDRLRRRPILPGLDAHCVEPAVALFAVTLVVVPGHIESFRLAVCLTPDIDVLIVDASENHKESRRLWITFAGPD